MWSPYSAVRCCECGMYWRTKAAYVNRLPDAPEDWYKNHKIEGGVDPFEDMQ